MPPEDAPKAYYVGYVNDGGIQWVPDSVGLSQEFPTDQDLNEPSYYDLLREDLGTLKAEVVYVDIKTFRWLRRMLGYTRLDYVWAYRRERKGHPRCR